MSTDPSPKTAPADLPPADGQEARIAFLFRTTQRQGRIHPLLHLVQQHRASRVPPAADALQVLA